MTPTRRKRRCEGFEPHMDCTNEATIAPAFLWCPRCEHLRREAISKSMAEITAMFERNRKVRPS